MVSSSSKHKPATPARLSSISTSLLSSILELSHQSSLDLPISPSIRSSIIKNLISFRDGMVSIQTGSTGQQCDPQIIMSLRDQYLRIVSLARGLNEIRDELGGLELDLPSVDSSPLIEIEVSQREDSLLSPVTRANQRDDASSTEDEENLDSTLVDVEDFKTNSRSRRALQEDEELMRAQNEDVQMLQQAMIEDQDRTLDQLSTAISRQRDLSLHISSELEVQENLLNELDERFDFTGSRLERANRKMNNVFRKIAQDGACWTIFGLVGFLLFLIVLLK
ncbi:hypothetical protein PPACK8108_LOCUS20930 [Phakopsora pachyrhizi]|uniref:t-SNARE coiled-coil homology domain-containing protein n=1 Tax=Phakopsora pachyrhizi TaxID=170000 RepID=A0AAV0BG77_PHAPC|nr:hypothetical protein PPACK8108_LOCUS20930 [Phakopsora pachyrhizi]